MQLDYFLPSPILRPLLTMHAAVHSVTTTHMEVLPAMLPNLHIRLAGESTYFFANGPPVTAPPVTLIGPTQASYRLAFGPGFRMMSVGLLPMGWKRLVGAPAQECTDTLLDGAALWSPQVAHGLLERLYSLPLDGRQTPVLEAVLSALVRPVRYTQQQHIATIDHWLEHAPDLSLDTLALQLGVGERQLRRLTLDNHGMPPKVLAMKYRALRLATALSHPRARHMGRNDVGESDGALLRYADQSHAIRDFQRFVGWTPGAFNNSPQGTARATLEGRRRAGAQRPLVLLS